MSFKFACPHCGQRISADDEDAGTPGGCPTCGRHFKVPNRELASPTFLTPRQPVKAPPWQDMKPSIKKEAAPEPRNGLPYTALILSFFPAINLVGLLLAIVSVVRADKDGHSGERGPAIGALVVCGILLLPVNIGGLLLAGPMLHVRLQGSTAFKPVEETPRTAPTAELPGLTPPSQKPVVASSPKAISKVVGLSPAPRATPEKHSASDTVGDDSQKSIASPTGSTEEAR